MATRGVELATDADAERLDSLRRACRSLPGRVRCKRCRGAIPGGKRRDSLYCSEPCKRAYRWERRDALVREIRIAVREAKVVPRCACGAELRTDVRPGSVPTACKRCYMREAQRRWRRAKGAPAAAENAPAKA